MTYTPRTGLQLLLPAAYLSLCSSSCSATFFETTLSLHVDNDDFQCDHENFSVKKGCGENSATVELLPSKSGAFPPDTVYTPWDRNLYKDHLLEKSSVFQFRGDTEDIIPFENVTNMFGENFTIKTWMKHAWKKRRQGKEHILCLSEGHGKRRRHRMSLFIRNCKLVFLLWRKVREGEENVFKPVEWRWNVPQVCDNTWHHYAIRVSSESVELYIDGELLRKDEAHVNVVDELPLHQAKNHRSVFTVGACWNGVDRKARHGFIGYLAQLSLLQNQREQPEVLKCLAQCSETLQLQNANFLEPGMEVTMNKLRNQVTIKGDNKESMNHLVRQVAYLNTKESPTPGRRRLELSTRINCRDGTKRQVPFALSSIVVLSVPQPTIAISGSENTSRGYEQFRTGVRIFADTKIILLTDRNQEDPLDYAEISIDRCSIHVLPPLNPDHEEIHLPESMLEVSNIIGSISNNGWEIIGTDKVYKYEQIVQLVTYINKKPAYYLNRQFKIVCSALNRRYVSNEYIQTVRCICFTKQYNYSLHIFS